MAVSIRLRRMGRKKQPHYRVVVADSRKAPSGRFVESLGYYRPLTEPARLVLDLERVDYWLDKGAIPSDTVSSLIRRARNGGDDKIAVGEVDLEAEKARKAEELAARRKAEAAAAAEEAKAAKTAKATKKKAAVETAEEEAEAPAKDEAKAEEPEAEADEEAAEEAPEVKAQAEGEAAEEAAEEEAPQADEAKDEDEEEKEK